LDSADSGQDVVAGICERGNELFGFNEGGEFIERLGNYYVPKKGFAPWDWLVG
jgi:hypothetical protein